VITISVAKHIVNMEITAKAELHFPVPNNMQQPRCKGLII